MTENAFFPQQGMPHSAIAPYIEIKPRPARRSSAVPENLDRKSQVAHLPPRHPELAGLTGTPRQMDIPTGQIHARLLVRDRLDRTDDSVRHLANSIRKNGLIRPIVVQDTSDGFELVEGARRLASFQLLHRETSDPRWANIPAVVLPVGTEIAELYHRMIAENLRSESLSLAEMATVAMSFAADPDTDPTTIEGAIRELYGRENRDMIVAITAYAHVLNYIGADLLFPNCLSLALVRALSGCIQSQTGAIRAIRRKLQSSAARSASEESVQLWRCVAAVAQ